MANAINDFTERDKVIAQYRELQAAAYQRRVNAALAKTTSKMLKDIAFLFFCLALVAAMGWVLWGTWIG